MATQPLTHSDSTAFDLAAGVRPTKLFIGGISRRTTTKQLRDHFSKVGRVLDCVAMRQPDGRPRGFGYVTLDSPEAAEQFLLAPQMIDDRIVDIKPAVPDTTEKDGGAKSDDSGRMTPQITGQMHNLLEPCQLRMMWPDGIDGSEDTTCTFPPTLLPGLPSTLLATQAGAQQHFAACEAAASWMQMYSGTHTWPWGGFDAARAAHTYEMMSRPHENAGRSCLTSTMPARAASASPLTLSTSPLSTPPGLTSAASSGAGCPKQMQPAKIPTTEQPPVPLPAGLVPSQKNSSKNVDSDSPPIVQSESDAKAESAAKVTDAKEPSGIMLLSLPTPSRRRSSTISTAASAEPKCSGDANGLSGSAEGVVVDESTKCATESLPAANEAASQRAKDKDDDDDDVAAPPGLQLPPPGLWHGLSTVAPTPEADAKGADSAAAAAAVSNAFLLLSTSPPAATSTTRPAAAATPPEASSLAQQKASGCREMGTQTEETLLTCPRCGRLERSTDSMH